MNKMGTLTEYFDQIEFDYGGKDNLVNILKNSIKNSQDKKYHGQKEETYYSYS